jgi:DNA-binding NarL/FixJ family response regulator
VLLNACKHFNSFVVEIRKMKILIVDSSVHIIKRWMEMLSETENLLSIEKAISYHEAVKVFKENMHDVVLLDLGLPLSKSFDLIWEMKKWNPDSIIFVLAIHTDSAIQEQCIELGADLFFDKYNDFEQIPPLIDAIAAKKKGNRKTG